MTMDYAPVTVAESSSKRANSSSLKVTVTRQCAAIAEKTSSSVGTVWNGKTAEKLRFTYMQKTSYVRRVSASFYE